MRLQDLAVATMTRARTRPEGKAVISALRALSELGVPIAVADRGSVDSVRRHLTRIPRVILAPPVGDGLVAQMNASLAGAATIGRRFVLYTEPDKRLFFERHLRRFIAHAPDTRTKALVIAARSAGAFSTFPPFQQRTETAANDLCRLALGQDGDYCYGPFLLPAALIKTVLPLPDGLGWGWRPYVFATAGRLGYDVILQRGAFRCPAPQRGEDNRRARDYRLSQFEENARGIVRALVANHR